MGVGVGGAHAPAVNPRSLLYVFDSPVSIIGNQNKESELSGTRAHTQTMTQTPVQVYVLELCLGLDLCLLRAVRKSSASREESAEVTVRLCIPNWANGRGGTAPPSPRKYTTKTDSSARRKKKKGEASATFSVRMAKTTC